MKTEEYLSGLPDTFQGMLDRLAHSPCHADAGKWLGRAIHFFAEEEWANASWRARELLVHAELISGYKLVDEFATAFLDHGLMEVSELKGRILRLNFVRVSPA